MPAPLQVPQPPPPPPGQRGPYDPRPDDPPKRVHDVAQGCCPPSLRPSLLYEGEFSFWPDETCRHGFHGVAIA